MTGGSEKLMKKGDDYYLDEFKNLACMVHKSEKGRLAITDLSSQNKGMFMPNTD